MAEQETPEQRERRERLEAANGVSRRRSQLDDARAGQTGQGKQLDTNKVREIRADLAAGGDQAVERRHGKGALGSAEAQKAKAQRSNVRKHESRLREASAERAGSAKGSPVRADQAQKAQRAKEKFVAREREARATSAVSRGR